MVKPMTTNMFGILEVKITARVRKRGFTPWKAWRKHWCNLKKSASGVELAVYNTVPVPDIISIPMQVITIPETCVCYRTDSRSKSFAFGLFADSKSRKAVMYLAGFSESNSQEWINAIRKALDKKQNSIINNPHLSYAVSLIDNAHSRAAGLFGIYGEMAVTPAGLIIHQPSGKFKHEEHLERFCINWNQILQCHLNNKRGGEDERKICIVHTNELFPNGPGQLLIFCVQAPKLLHSIMTQCNKILTTKLSTPKRSNCDNGIRRDNSTKQNCDISSKCENNFSRNTALNTYPACNRMSRSEGDLCGYCESDRDSGWSSCSPPEYNSMLAGVDQRNLTASEMRLSMSSEDSSFVLKGKVADSLISTGLLLNSLAKSSNDDDFQTNDITNFPLISETIDPRRVSAVSVASGVYEEILENPVPCSLVTAPPLSALYEEPLYMPPPLPPRGRHTSHTSTSDDGIEDDDCDCATPITAKSLHPHLYNWNLHEKSQILSVSSPNVNSTQVTRKFSKQQILETDRNYENSTHILDETNQISVYNQTHFEGIPRCNTEPQQSLRPFKINENNDLVRKSRNRFDLTPIRNKLNHFMKNRLDNGDNSPKSKSHFYNSLPRSSNIMKRIQNTPKKIFKNGASRSCELLDCEEIEQTIPSQILVRSCDLLDCVQNSPILSPMEINLDNTNQRTESLDSERLDNNISCDILQQTTKESNEPNFSQMRCEWTESRISKNAIEFDYVPMSPNVIKTSEESNYMDMTGTKGRDISSTIVNGSPKLDYGQI